MNRRQSVVVLAAVALAAVVLVVAVVHARNGGQQQDNPGRPLSHSTPPAGAGGAGTPVCDRPILRSPWDYHGVPGSYTTSGRPAGLPTFGAAGTDFPTAKSVVAVPAGDNTSAAASGHFDVDNTVVYFEPGVHDIRGGMYSGHDSAYVGGYTAAIGKAILDGVDGGTGGTGKGGSWLAYSTPSSGNNVRDVWEYLTIKNYASGENSSVMGNVNGGGSDNGDVYKYDTIGPNEYGLRGDTVVPATGQSSGGGYAIDAGSDTTIEFNCLTRNAQGAFNVSNAVNLEIAHNEISWNGLGEYPDTGESPGASPYACGCSGGGKIFFSLNADVVDNYIHDNYNTGLWFDFDNAGANISHNYIASNWGSGIMYEASYNARIAGNTLVGNGWASDGAWPAGVGGGACYGGISCTNGNGPVTGAGGGNPYAAIDLSNSGGNSSLTTVRIPAGTPHPGCSSPCQEKSRYAGELLVENNVLSNNFGGIKVYTDTNRYPGNIDNDSACSIPIGALNQSNSSTYYKQGNVLTTAADTTISGSLVTSAVGTKTICAGYGKSTDDGPGNTVVAPSTGMAVYDQNSGTYLGTVASVISAKAFTLSRSPGNRTGTSLLLSGYGGCGPADYFGGRLGAASGRPSAAYWDNCIWGSRNVKVSGNSFAMDASSVTGCSMGNLCGYMAAEAFNAGVPALMKYWDTYINYIANASGGLGNVWSDNTYQWSGGGPGEWQFQTGTQGNQVSQAQWLAPPYDQDAGSSFR